MSLNFDQDRWAKIKHDYQLWWDGKLKRPLLQATVIGTPGRPEPALPRRVFASHYDLSVAPEAIVDRWDYDLSRNTWLGDAFPTIYPSFGPGVVAAFLGAGLKNTETTTWFHPSEVKAIEELRFAYQPGNVWLERIKTLCRIAMDRWQGMVQVGMTDLGGTLDIISSFRPGEALLLDLYDRPAEVERLAWQTHDLWWRYFEEIDSVLRPVNPGYTTWSPIFSEQSYYMLQCDFCYMISPEMFDRFVKPELAAACRKLKHAFYHLDGIGQLPHLDSILSIKELKGIQWVPGAGQPDNRHWIDVFRRIRKAGKLIEVRGAPEVLDGVVEQLGSGEGLIAFGTFARDKVDKAKAWLKRHGAD